MTPFHDPRDFAFVPRLEAAFDEILAEVDALATEDFVDWPEALTTVRDGYDESGWKFFGLFSSHDRDVERLYDLDENRRKCSATTRACAAIPGMTDAGFSLFLPGTHLWPHQGELSGLLRCHLPLRAPARDHGIRVGGETRTWTPGRCLVFDDTFLHDAWNHGDTARVVLLVTFARNRSSAANTRSLS